MNMKATQPDRTELPCDPVVQQALSALAPQLPLLLAQFAQSRSGTQ